MENVLNSLEILKKAELFIREEEYEKAKELLKAIEDEEYIGQALFNLGNIALFMKDNTLALQYYKQSLQKKFQKFEVYENLAHAYELCSELSEAEDYYRMAMKKASTLEMRWSALTNLGNFYYRNGLMLKAEKAAKQAIDQFSNEYYGHHLLFLIWMKKQRFEEIEKHFAIIGTKFEKNPLYQIDRLAYYDERGKYSAELKLIEEDPVVMEVIPDIALRQKVNILLKRKTYSQTEESIKILFEKYGDLGSGFSVMLILMLEGQYIKAAEIAEYIMEREIMSQGILYQLTRYVKMIILYLLNQETQNEEISEFIKEEARECLEWFTDKEVASESMKKAVEQILVS